MYTIIEDNGERYEVEDADVFAEDDGFWFAEADGEETFFEFFESEDEE